jgi:hypothetical protein
MSFESTSFIYHEGNYHEEYIKDFILFSSEYIKELLMA